MSDVQLALTYLAVTALLLFFCGVYDAVAISRIRTTGMEVGVNHHIEHYAILAFAWPFVLPLALICLTIYLIFMVGVWLANWLLGNHKRSL